MYICRHFDVREFVPESIYNRLGANSWEAMDDRILIMADIVRSKFGRTVCNTWHSKNLQSLIGGYSRKASGLRLPSDPSFSPTSQHTFGRAVDLITVDTPVAVAREYILAHPSEFEFITGVELDVSWLHIDVRNCKPIKTFKPK